MSVSVSGLLKVTATKLKKKKKKPPSVGVELRAGRELHRSEKPGWSAGDMR